MVSKLLFFKILPNNKPTNLKMHKAVILLLALATVAIAFQPYKPQSKPKPFKPLSAAPARPSYQPAPAAPRASPKYNSNYAASSAESGDEKAVPIPYSFKFDTPLDDGGASSREESSDGNGSVQGSYTIQDPKTGAQRTVQYTADETGFHAQIQSNEPGIVSGQSADATFQKI